VYVRAEALEQAVYDVLHEIAEEFGEPRPTVARSTPEAEAILHELESARVAREEDARNLDLAMETLRLRDDAWAQRIAELETAYPAALEPVKSTTVASTVDEVEAAGIDGMASILGTMYGTGAAVLVRPGSKAPASDRITLEPRNEATA
jgi:hypothetical protein